MSVSVYFSVVFHFSICSIFFIIHLKFYVASLVGWSCFRPSSLKCCFPPMGWRCFLLHFGEVMSPLLSPFWVVLPSSLLSMVLQSPSRLVGGAAALSLPPCGWCCFPSSSFRWCCLSLSLLCVVLPSPSPLGAASLPPPFRWCCRSLFFRMQLNQ